LPRAGGHIGATLRSAREDLSLSLDDMSARLNIAVPSLKAIETMDETALPSTAFAVGQVKAYARELGVPVNQAVDEFKQYFSTDKKIEVQISQKSLPKVYRPTFKQPKGILSGLVALVVFACLMFVFTSRSASSQADLVSLVSEGVDTNDRVIAAQSLSDDMYRLTAIKASLVEIRDPEGDVLLRRIFTPGQKWEGAVEAGFIISVRDGGALSLERGPKSFGPLASPGTILTMIELELLEDRLTDKLAIGVQGDLYPR